MLIVHRLAHGAHRYYLGGVSREPGDAPAVGEVAGRWMGQGAASLGLGGEVGSADLRRVLPSGRSRVPGFDLTFAAPKSVSVVHGLASSEVASAVRHAHDAAVVAAMAYLERHACAVRADGHPVEGGGFVAAAFRHRVSRADDPHLHTHVIVANQAQGPDGQWRALHSPLLYAERRAASAVYHTVLRHEVGHAIEVAWSIPVGGRADVTSVPEQVRRAFSQRRAQVIASAGDDATRRRWAERVTRPERDGPVPFAALVVDWHARAADLGWAVPPLSPPTVAPTPALPATSDLLPGSDRWTRGDVLVALADHWVAGAPAEVITTECDRLLGLSDVMSLGRGGSPRHAAERFTTHTATERRARILGELRAAPPVGSSALALDELRRELAAEGRRLVLLTADASAAASLAARTGAPAQAIAAAAFGADRADRADRADGAGNATVAVIVRPDRLESALVEAAMQAAARAEVEVRWAEPGRGLESGTWPDAGAVTTIPIRDGLLTAAGAAALASSVAVGDWADARDRGVTAVLTAPAEEVAALNVAAREALRGLGRLGEDEVAGFSVGDAVRFTAARPAAGIARHATGQIVHVDAVNGRLAVELADGGRVDLTAASASSVRHAHVVPPIPSLIGRPDHLYVIGGPVPASAPTVVHRYVTVDAPVGVPQPAWVRDATIAQLDDAAHRRQTEPSLTGRRRRHDEQVRSVNAWIADASRRYVMSSTPTARAAWAAQLSTARREADRLLVAGTDLVRSEKALQAGAARAPRDHVSARGLDEQRLLRRAALAVAAELGGPMERSEGLQMSRGRTRGRELAIAI
ncbi:MAG: MobF family relaxase [Acidimicrobiales bacterium]